MPLDENANLDELWDAANEGTEPEGYEEENTDGVDGSETDVGDGEDDASSEDETLDGEEEDEGSDDEDVAGTTQPSRQTRRTQSLANARKEAEERAERAERELARFQEQQNSQRQAEDQRREAELVANMSPEEKKDYLLDKRLKSFENAQAQANFRADDANDKASFASLAGQNTKLGKLANLYRDKVEARLKEVRAKGWNFPREEVFTRLLGESVKEKAATANSSQQRAGRRRIASQRTNSVSQRGNTTGSSGRGKTLEQRLEGQQL